MRVYISGPISGLPEAEFKANFDQAQIKLLRMGHDTVNPLSVTPCDDKSCGSTETFDDGSYKHTWACYMKYDLIALLQCDAIATLPNYRNSRGAVIEYNLAMELGLKRIFLEDTDV